MFLLFISLIGYTVSSPLCHCPNDPNAMPCPSPIQMNCPPPPQCPMQQPCLHPMHTLPPMHGLGDGMAPGMHHPLDLSQFTFPPHPGFQHPGIPGFGMQPTPQPLVYGATLPPAPIPPSNGQENLVPIMSQGQELQYPNAVVQPVAQPQHVQPQLLQLQPQQPITAYGAQGENTQSSLIKVIDYSSTSTTTASPLPTMRPEAYAEAEIPEETQAHGIIQQQAVLPSDQPAEASVQRFGVFENEPNSQLLSYKQRKEVGFRSPQYKALAANTKAEPLGEKCNDERLKKIILENVDSNPSTSKRKIQKAATEQVGGLFDVICSAHDFSYLANTQLFCEAGNDDVTCFAFLHSLIQ